MLSGWLPLLALLVATWVLVLGICLTWRRGKGYNAVSSFKLQRGNNTLNVEAIPLETITLALDRSQMAPI